MANDDYIRQIVRDEIQKQNSKSRFNISPTNRHVHNGTDSPKINSGNITPGLRTTGEVEFDSAKDYVFNVNFAPSQITLYGIVSNTSIGYRALVIGQAALGQNLYFQPTTTSSVTVGGNLGIVQSYAQILVVDANFGSSTGGFAKATADDQHILSITDGTTIYARATVSSYGQNSFTITVDTLASGWKINGSYFVT